MKLLVPILPEDSAGPLRVIVVVKSTAQSLPRRRGNAGEFIEDRADAISSACMQAACRAGSYLDIVYRGATKVVMICREAAPGGSESGLEQAMNLIAAGEVDLVITTDLTRFSRHPVEVMEFLQFCQRNDTRVIAFEDHLDTGDYDWDNNSLGESLLQIGDG